MLHLFRLLIIFITFNATLLAQSHDNKYETDSDGRAMAGPSDTKSTSTEIKRELNFILDSIKIKMGLADWYLIYQTDRYVALIDNASEISSIFTLGPSTDTLINQNVILRLISNMVLSEKTLIICAEDDVINKLLNTDTISQLQAVRRKKNLLKLYKRI